MNIKYLSIKEEVHKHKVLIEHIGTNLMIVDLLTKGLQNKKFIGILIGWVLWIIPF